MKKNTSAKLAFVFLIFCACNGEKKKEETTALTVDTVSAPKDSIAAFKDTTKVLSNKTTRLESYCNLIESPGEVKLDYGDPSVNGNRYSYKASSLERSRKNFNKIFNLEGPTQIINNPDQIVRASELSKLAKYIADNFAPGPKDLKGIRLLYGIDGNTMFCMFEPVLLKFQGTDKPRYDIIHSLLFYRPNSSGDLGVIPTKDTIKYTDPYRSESGRMDIFHMEFPDDEETNKFIDMDENFIYGDSKFCVMPLQQIFRMFKENKGDCDDPAKNKIIFSLLANNYFKTSGIPINNYKLHVVAHYEIGVLPLATNSYAGVGADFSQMSPPNNRYVVLPNEIIIKRKEKFDISNSNKSKQSHK